MGKDRLFARVSFMQYLRASGALRWSGTIKKQNQSRGPTLEETQQDHKLPLGRDILKKKKNNNNKKEKSDFLKIIFRWIFNFLA